MAGFLGAGPTLVAFLGLERQQNGDHAGELAGADARLTPDREDRSRAFPGTLQSFSPDPGQVRSRLLNKGLELSYSLRSGESAGRIAGGAKANASKF
jgi:hypothetical protein